MTHFFAMPDETEAWVREIVEELDLVRHDERFLSGLVQTFVWPADHEVPSPVPGVLVQPPQLLGDILTMGVTGWKSSAFTQPTAAQGIRLNRRLTRSLRRWVTIPLFPVTRDGLARDAKPFAWGSPRAVDGAYVLRQFRDGAVSFVA